MNTAELYYSLEQMGKRGHKLHDNTFTNVYDAYCCLNIQIGRIKQIRYVNCEGNIFPEQYAHIIQKSLLNVLF